jgi:acetyl-CoA carboxylase/biotin carboxylase 1
VVSQLEAKYKEIESISTTQNIDFPAKLLKGILEVS